MCLNLPEWLLFFFPIVIPCRLGCVVTYFKVYELTRSYDLRDCVAVFLKRQNLILYIVAGSI